jgi:hypothetical protein
MDRLREKSNSLGCINAWPRDPHAQQPSHRTHAGAPAGTVVVKVSDLRTGMGVLRLTTVDMLRPSVSMPRLSSVRACTCARQRICARVTVCV